MRQEKGRSMPLNRSPSGPPLAVVLSERLYNAELLANVLINSGLTSIERPACQDNLRVTREIEPEIVFMVGNPSNHQFLSLTRSLARTYQQSIVALVPENCGDGEAAMLRAGADACLHDTDRSELAVATVRSLLRRNASARAEGRFAEPAVLEIGPIEVHQQRFQVSAYGKPLHLTAHEYQVFLALAKRVNRVRCPREILEDGTGRLCTDREARDIVKVYVQRIRSKLESAGLPRSTIRNVRSIGYMLQEPEPERESFASSSPAAR